MFTPCTCPFLILCIISYPCHVFHAVSNEKKPIPGFTRRLMRAMILFDQIMEILTLPQFASDWKSPCFFQFAEGFGRRGVLVDRNHAGSDSVTRIERFGEERFGRLRISFGAEKKLRGISLRLHCPIHILPDVLHFHRGLIDAPRIRGSFELRSAAFLQFRGLLLDPPIHRCRIY